MGYAYYELTRFDQPIMMKRGYGVSCKCHKRGCKEKIDRGLAYLCYQCGWYYCGKHLTSSYCTTHDEHRELECFAGEDSQVCFRCDKLLEKWEKKHPCEEEH